MRTMFLSTALALFIMSGVTSAQQEDLADPEMASPPMGPPDQMEEVAFLIGEWTADMQWRMDSESEWEESRGTAVYSSILGGGAIMLDYTDETMAGMPMPFHGIGIQTYDRETGEWQMMWMDNIMCRQSMYTGNKEGDKTVLTGEDRYAGMTMLSRITTYNETASSFDWKMENSMDGGKTWFVSGKAHYEKNM